MRWRVSALRCRVVRVQFPICRVSRRLLGDLLPFCFFGSRSLPRPVRGLPLRDVPSRCPRALPWTARVTLLRPPPRRTTFVMVDRVSFLEAYKRQRSIPDCSYLVYLWSRMDSRFLVRGLLVSALFLMLKLLDMQRERKRRQAILNARRQQQVVIRRRKRKLWVCMGHLLLSPLTVVVNFLLRCLSVHSFDSYFYFCDYFRHDPGFYDALNTDNMNTC